MQTLELPLNMPKYHTTPEALEIYEAYPRKVGKPVALRFIIKAIKRFGYDHVLEKTKAFAKKFEESAKEICYIPYPATFFNQERFNDDFEAMFPVVGVARPAKPPSLAQRAHALEVLIEENAKALVHMRLPEEGRYEGGKESRRYQTDFQNTLSKRTALKQEQARLKAQLSDVLKQVAKG